MVFWIKRIVLKDGEVVTERELRHDENRFDGSAPVVGDLIEVRCRGQKFTAIVMWGNWPGRIHPTDTIVPLRVAEVGLDPSTPLRFPSLGGSQTRHGSDRFQPISSLRSDRCRPGGHLRTSDRPATIRVMMKHADSQTVSVSCPSCGCAGHSFFGQSVLGGELRWYRSVCCPTSGNIEEDGIGGGPSDLRNELLKSKGNWEVRVEGVEKVKSITAAKRLLSLSNDHASFLLQSYPNLLVGTKAEADWLVEKLAAEGIRGETAAPGGNDS